MRTLSRLTMFGLGLVLVACSSGGSPTSDGTDPAVSVTSPPNSSVTPPPGGGPQTMEPRAGMEDVRPISFDSATPSADDRSLTIAFTSGVEPCSVLDRVDVDLQSDAVVVTLYVGHEPTPEPVACIEIAAFYETTVELGEPLAGRPVLDGATP